MRDLMSYLASAVTTIAVALVAMAILFFGGVPSLLGVFLLTVAMLIIIGALCRGRPYFARFSHNMRKFFDGHAWRGHKRWARQKYLKYNEHRVRLKRVGAGSFIHQSDHRFSLFHARDQGDFLDSCA